MRVVVVVVVDDDDDSRDEAEVEMDGEWWMDKVVREEKKLRERETQEKGAGKAPGSTVDSERGKCMKGERRV